MRRIMEEIMQPYHHAQIIEGRRDKKSAILDAVVYIAEKCKHQGVRRPIEVGGKWSMNRHRRCFSYGGYEAQRPMGCSW